MKKGFTLIEILIVLAILSLVFSVVVPFSYSLYTYYTETHEIEKVALTLSSLRREAFLYNRENIVYEKNGILYLNDNPLSMNFKFKMDKPIIFFKNGTSSGGIISVFTGKNLYKIEVNSPFGEIHYEKS
ncbi:MAG: type II secretion system protein [Thermodesulfovibrionaceae bacterium]